MSFITNKDKHSLSKTILYTILNWGLGHATRAKPLIQFLINEGYTVILASDGEAKNWLENEFPNLQVVTLPEYNPIYANSAAQFAPKMAMQIPKFLKAIKKEQQVVASFVEQNNIDLIISDNRYGCYHFTIPSIIICHQLYLRYPKSRLFEKIVNASYNKFFKPFDAIWVPDLAPPNHLSGEMSESSLTKNYIGIESRLSKESIPQKYTYLAVLSGPEPQRQLFENEIINAFSKTEKFCVIVRGTKAKLVDAELPRNIAVFDLVDTASLNELINQSELVICRSGYTSIIDILHLQKKVIFVPTPGQLEQEYLAESLIKQGYVVQQQSNLNLTTDVKVNKTKNLSYNYSFIQQQLASFLT